MKAMNSTQTPLQRINGWHHQEPKAERLKPFLREYVEDITTRKGASYICPLCGSGSGQNGTAAFSIQHDGEHWKCFSCEEGGDLFDLIGKVEGMAGYSEQATRAEELFGAAPQPTRRSEPEPTRQAVDFTPFIEAARRAISRTDYPEQRGLSREAIEVFRLGYYDPSDTTAQETIIRLYGYDPIKAPALIIPYPGTGYFIARRIDPKGNIGKHFKPKAETAGEEPLFNLAALHNSEGKPVFTVEAPLDAISIWQAGGYAIAASGTNRRRLLDALPTSCPIIIAADDDGPGREAAGKLESELKQRGISHLKADLFSAAGAKDANELLQTDPAALADAVHEAIRKIDPREAHQANSAAERLRGFLNGIQESVNTPCISTGFKELDGLLDGGLYEGLYAIGAISSMGKTTFTLHTVDQIAAAGHDVLFFSLEMGANEIMAKSISRLTLELCAGYPGNAKTARGILDGKRYARYSQREKDLISRAVNEYHEKTAQRLFIIEGTGNIGVMQVRDAVERHVEYTGRRPVVVIDYLQILAPYNDRATDKQNTDKAVLELKRISRDMKTPVLAISSFNRQNYNGHVSMEAFKESGAIEYSADVVIGIQPEGMKGAKEEGAKNIIHNHKAKTRREVEVFILKNRNGQTNKGVKMVYETLFNHFKENGQADYIEQTEEAF